MSLSEHPRIIFMTSSAFLMQTSVLPEDKSVQTCSCQAVCFFFSFTNRKTLEQQVGAEAFLTLVNFLQALQHTLVLFGGGVRRRLVIFRHPVLGLSRGRANGFLLAPELGARVEVSEAVLDDILQWLPTSRSPLCQICSRVKMGLAQWGGEPRITVGTKTARPESKWHGTFIFQQTLKMFLVAVKLSQQLLARLLILGSLLRLLLSFLHQLLEDSHRVCLLHRIREGNSFDFDNASCLTDFFGSRRRM